MTTDVLPRFIFQAPGKDDGFSFPRNFLRKTSYLICISTETGAEHRGLAGETLRPATYRNSPPPNLNLNPNTQPQLLKSPGGRLPTGLAGAAVLGDDVELHL